MQRKAYQTKYLKLLGNKKMIQQITDDIFVMQLILKTFLGWIDDGIQLIKSIRRSLHGCQGLSQTGQSFGAITPLIDLRVFPLGGSVLHSDCNLLVAQQTHVKKNL
ncbi:hypothetical protein [Prochlorococcus sp. MIT 1341]|uniref:hypothetical protein n=1 Tax=Prochlorococcus sp. MIT 1341 TaxID=3096221 RepID=UPI002A75A07A|nr:hypothetical protein [Prochlorococcus sp. MIT 1341]